MPIYIKAGYWDKLKQGFKGYFDLDNYINEKFTTELGVKSYTVSVTQSSTNSPVLSVLKNDYSGTISMIRNSTGSYSIISSLGEFTANKTMPNSTIQTTNDESGNKLTAQWISVNEISIKTYNSSDVLTDGILNNTPIYIETYS